MSEITREEEITISDVFRLIWRRRWLVALIVTILTAGGVVYALTATPLYQADVAMMPAGKSQLSGALGQLGGLASLAGINLDSSDNSQTPLAVLRSKSFARDFIEQNHLIDRLLERNIGFLGISTWDFSASEAPDIRDAVKNFDDKVRSVSEDKKSGLITLSVTWKDSSVAAQWANEMVTNLNNRLRAQAGAEAKKNIAYLQAEIASTNIPALQQSLSKILEGEMQKLLLANGNDQFAFKVIDSATPPKKRSFPNRPIIVVGTFLLGLFLSIIIVIVAEFKLKR